jgi:hypothetical protein
MTSVKDIIRHNIHKASEDIHAIKQPCSTGNIRPNSTDGHVMSDWKKYQDLKASASLNLTALKILKANDGAVPENKGEFVAVLDKDMAACSLERKAKSLSTETDPRKIMSILRGRPSLSAHAPAGKARSHAIRAFKLLRKVANELEKYPSLFADAGVWAKVQEQESSARRAGRVLANA